MEVWSYDISSAYPYQLFQLPCLTCGTWKLYDNPAAVYRALKRPTTRLACVFASTPKKPANDLARAWGAFPFRYKDGTTAYPLHNPGVWVWQDEFRVGRKHWKAEAHRAWVYSTKCACRPFAKIAEAYLERTRIGKEGRGKVLKLGCNSCYGACCQHKGSAKFQSYIWAGAITSGTRAQLLELIASAKDPTKILMTATDGILSLERLKPPKPIDTGTWHAGDPDPSKPRKPLGGWEEEHLPNGVHLIRPGIYFPLNPSDKEKKKVRSRGFGRKVLFANMARVLDEWKRQGPHRLEFLDQMFWGMKSCLLATREGVEKLPRYGTWQMAPRVTSYDPLPKRAAVEGGGRLTPWDRPRRMPKPYHMTFPGRQSALYKPAMVSPEAAAMAMARDHEEEQPDAGGDVE